MVAGKVRKQLYRTRNKFMRHKQIDSRLFTTNRARLTRLLSPNSLVVINSNDVPPTNADGTLALPASSDLFYLTGVEQEQSILVMYPDADEEKHRTILFLREPTKELEIWEGSKLTKENVRALSGIDDVLWLPEFPRLFHRLMCECDHVYLNSNEHKRAVIEVESREARFVADVIRRYPLHDFRRLAPLMHTLRAVKSSVELELIQKACQITEDGFRRVLRSTHPGVSEMEVEAEFAHEFIRQGGRFAFLPIIASGANACGLHYVTNSAVCRKGELLLLDVAASYANYNADMTRTIPVSGKFTRRQKQVYRAVLRVLRECIRGLKPGKKPKDWQKEAEQSMEKELVDLGLITVKQIREQTKDAPAFKQYFMHGVGHPLGLDVHDVTHTIEPMQAGWVMTVEPGIYLPEEGFAVRLENDVLVTENGPVDLLADTPLEPEEIEELMQQSSSNGNRPTRSGPNGRNGRKLRRLPARRTAVVAGD
jgi:Xaa-Pro aminopeptidase